MEERGKPREWREERADGNPAGLQADVAVWQGRQVWQADSGSG